MADLFNDTGAEFSRDGKYRYSLWRIWDRSLPLVMCIGLNPSTANAEKNDPTIINLIKMLTILGFGGFYMTNLFALISSKPEALLTCDDPIGDNDKKLQEIKLMCEEIIVCWGSFKQAEERIKQVLPMFPNAKCFGWNKNNTPFHPLAMMYKGTVKNPQLFLYQKK